MRGNYERRGRLLLWHELSDALRFAEARAFLFGRRQRVRRLDSMWHVERGRGLVRRG